MTKYVRYCEYKVDSGNIINCQSLRKIKDDITCYYENNKRKETAFSGTLEIVAGKGAIFSSSIRQIIHSLDDINLEKQSTTFRQICMVVCRSESKDESLARHIRNSFSHWNFYLKKCGGAYRLLLLDFTEGGNISAVICCPLKSLKKLANLYSNLA